METIFTTLCIQFANRSNAKKKVRFLNWAISYFQKLGYPIEIVNDKAKFGRVCDVIFGDLKKAKQVILVPYDTPLKFTIKKGGYYPLNKDKNRKVQLQNLLVQTLVSILWMGIAFLFMYASMKQEQVIKYGMWVVCCICFFPAFLFGKGIGNRYNFNRNTAAIAVAMDLAKDKKDTLAYVFIDATTQSYKGYQLLVSKYEAVLAKQTIILLDCIGTSDPCHILTTQTCHEDALQPYWYSIDTDEHSVLSMFKHSYLLTRAKLEEEEWIVEHTGTKKDNRVDFPALEEDKQIVTLLSATKK